MRAFIFPGQGSQSVGMGRALADASPAARAVFDEVDEALGRPLFRLMSEGPLDELTLTENAQPAIMANAIATLRMLENDGGVALADTAAFVAGHSLGEYTALCAAGALDLATTARLLRLRGRAMQAAVPVGEGAMAALLGVDVDKAELIAGAAVDSLSAEGVLGQVCTVANDNDPGQVVISGHRVAVERAAALAKEMGAKRALLLPVSAPFHCPLMEDAARAMAAALADTELAAPTVPLVNNVDAVVLADPGAIRASLVAQVTGRVRWRESVLAMRALGVERFVEVGGKVLAPMVKRSAAGAEAISIVSPADVKAFVATL